MFAPALVVPVVVSRIRQSTLISVPPPLCTNSWWPVKMLVKISIFDPSSAPAPKLSE
jgi:hypothetical protein